MRKTVAIGFLGTVLDQGGRAPRRWQKWRPTVSLCMQKDLPIDRLEVLHSPDYDRLANRVKEDISQTSPHTDVRLTPLAIRDPWDFEEVYAALLDFARAYTFHTDHEDYLIHITTGTHVAQICWFLLAEARYLPARLVQTAPPQRTDEGPSGPGAVSVIDLDLSRYNRIAQRFQRERDETVSFLKAGIATRNACFNALIEQLERVAARSRAPMLLVGPTGAGKSFLARRVYELKRARHRLAGPFIEVNCATLRGDAAMSTLFGHVKGAFTGAQAARAGLLRAADGGLLFLDEIGELGLDEQAMLLKAVEEKRFFPVGSDSEVTSDFELIAGTHRDLRQMVAAGTFREDLYARINLWTYELPRLADRREDVEPNLEFELDRFGREHGESVRFNVEARRRYVAFATSPRAIWSGNFRELSASVTRMATLADAGRITEAIAEEEVARLSATWSAPRDTSDLVDMVDAVLGAGASELDLFDRAQLEQVLDVCRVSRSLSEAGRALFAVSRQGKKQPNDADRLRKYLARFRLDWEGVRQALENQR
ncbi:RNA repair transcriptional activator RtcR [Paraburkholderia phenoliruptrix]|uniref:RNA repair transcriptional activator RtcR n=1 Tax=Paraburkholderia phenoliruptrix TaxID=252970 RepID=UPI001C6E5BD5|nr:RNA repair transcriptional activator RtcR [Paraburkholderia phenoliruptrix]MBW9107868.1 sigma 54-interacting transcriptional regulator [Paraburkholderia phenoliruptrix]MBW9133113.1 sigma 54-interacting transcriptional regulator [Paraburkholderia ginsengiterrae]